MFDFPNIAKTFILFCHYIKYLNIWCQSVSVFFFLGMNEYLFYFNCLIMMMIVIVFLSNVFQWFFYVNDSDVWNFSTGLIVCEVSLCVYSLIIWDAWESLMMMRYKYKGPTSRKPHDWYIWYLVERSKRYFDKPRFCLTSRFESIDAIHHTYLHNSH